MLRRLRAIALTTLGATAFALTSCSSGDSTLAPQSPPPPAPAGIQLRPLSAPAGVFPTTTSSAPTGIVGNFVTNLVRLENGNTAGGMYNVASGAWTSIQMPSASSTAAYGPAITTSGYRVVGNYVRSGSQNSHGFVYDSGSNAFTTIDPPAAFCAPHACNETIAHSNYGATSFKAVGNCDSVAGAGPGPGVYPATGHAFLYDSASETFTKIDMARALSTTAYGIWVDGSQVAVAGGFSDAKGTHAYVRDLTGGKVVTYDYSGAFITHFEGITGAGGTGNYNVVGDFANKGATGGGFFLPIRNWVAGKAIVIGSSLSANSVYQRTVVGITIDAATMATAGYITTIPGS